VKAIVVRDPQLVQGRGNDIATAQTDIIGFEKLEDLVEREISYKRKRERCRAEARRVLMPFMS
jgi:hypothetical protein